MKRRFAVYGFGVVLGLIMAWALFLRGRNTSNYTAWTPNNRILEEIRLDTTLQTTDKFWCEMKCLGFSSIEYNELLLTGNVDFSTSQVKTWPRTYRVEFDTESNGIMVVDFIFNENNHREIKSVSKKGEEISCDC